MKNKLPFTSYDNAVTGQEQGFYYLFKNHVNYALSNVIFLIKMAKLEDVF